MQFYKRFRFIGLCLLLVLVLFICRLAQLQLFATESLSDEHVDLIRQSVEQRTSEFVIDNGRGSFLYRNKETMNPKQNQLVLFPFLKTVDWPANKVAKILHINANDLKQAVLNADKPFVFNQPSLHITSDQKQQINALNLTGVHALSLNRDRFGLSAPYLIGITGENQSLVKKRYPDLLNKGMVSKQTTVGLTGLQRAFDPFLISRDQEKLLYHTTGTGQPMFEDSMRLSAIQNQNYFPLHIQTTINQSLQDIAEQAVEQSNIDRGGVAIVDVSNSDLLAMVNRPKMMTNDPFSGGHQNNMLTAKFPGSIFKVVTAAASIGHNIITNDQQYNCNLGVYGEEQADRQLGQLGFKDSFYQSCNYTFATLANRLMKTDLQVMEDYADKLGLTGRSGWSGDVFHINDLRQFPEEQANTIWQSEDDKHSKKAIAQTAIGQLNVKLTPLSVVNMMATIARGGQKKEVRAASKILYNNKSMPMTTFPSHEQDGKTLAPYTIMKLQSLLRGVVTDSEGTAHSLNKLPMPIAGKSGTAETDGAKNYHWFAGYFPADDPQYAMVVANFSSQKGEETVYDVFGNIIKQMSKQKQAETS
ncbi:penicillin-binding transpeptidase domain-containing protein [Tuberibacillus sp. Marseille-P3662]|uniref:penicillin-binding transpeptidase domain-containing protein n=1 Tax=Tuberibacillus sp. Marseille-P3662 TaxID=1965358 RepID=UPI000A1C98A4|nr:penicillin-binding transpeptidase domain-containing protein [Tuberibacillus sp. Marseille-P3662]